MLTSDCKLHYFLNNKCDRKTTKGDIVNWDTVTLDLVNMTEHDRHMDELCIPIRPGHVAFPMKRNFTSHVSLCNKLKGMASVVRDNNTMVWMNKNLKQHTDCRNNIGRFHHLPCERDG